VTPDLWSANRPYVAAAGILILGLDPPGLGKLLRQVVPGPLHRWAVGVSESLDEMAALPVRPPEAR
jgi:hypothetical protein